MGRFIAEQHEMTCNCSDCIVRRHYWILRAMDTNGPAPKQEPQMKQAEPVDDEPIAQIEWKHVNPITRLIRRLRGKDEGE